MRKFLLALTTVTAALTAATQAPHAQTRTTISGFPAAEDGARLSFPADPANDARIAVRLAGVTAPAPDAYPYGAWAHLALGDVVTGNEVTCRLSDNQNEGVCIMPGLGDLARWAVMNGFAVPEPGPAGDPYAAAAREARMAKRGIWGGVR